MGLSLTDSSPTDDYGKEVTKSGPDKSQAVVGVVSGRLVRFRG